jgi:hypothetical protein
MNSIDSSIVFVAIVALLMNALILYIVIAAATQSRKRALYDWASLDLLAKIAKAQGVPQEEVADTFRRAGLAK